MQKLISVLEIVMKKGFIRNALKAYLEILTNCNKSNELILIAIIRSLILNVVKKDTNHLVKYYSERIVIDPLISKSFDIKYLAFTEWESESLTIKNLSSEEITLLTNKNWFDLLNILCSLFTPDMVKNSI